MTETLAEQGFQEWALLGSNRRPLPCKGWYTILGLYSPLEAFFDKSWQVGEIELID